MRAGGAPSPVKLTTRKNGQKVAQVCAMPWCPADVSACLCAGPCAGTVPRPPAAPRAIHLPPPQCTPHPPQHMVFPEGMPGLLHPHPPPLCAHPPCPAGVPQGHAGAAVPSLSTSVCASPLPCRCSLRACRGCCSLTPHPCVLTPLALQVFPKGMPGLLFPGFVGEVWIEPGKEATQVRHRFL